jgi:hypothetical protein
MSTLLAHIEDINDKFLRVAIIILWLTSTSMYSEINDS